MRKIVIAGGSGFLGQALVERFRDTDANIIILSRNPGWIDGNVSSIQWDAKTLGDWAHAIEGSIAIINLVGRSVNCRYTEKNKKAIVDSRVDATLAIGKAIEEAHTPPAVWINASSVAIFGDSGDQSRDEDSSPGEGFSPGVCKKWEKAFYSISTPYTRKVVLRMGLVFQRNRGLLKPFVRLAKLGLGGKVGSGNQFISWVHEDDFIHIVETIIRRNDIEGTIHCVSPFPITNAEFLRTLRGACRIPFGLPTPAFLLKIGAPVIGTQA